MPLLRKMTSAWAKKLARRWLWRYRRVTWRSRSLPEFLIVGAQKSGTTSLFDYLKQHPQLVPSYKKEVHFFDGGLHPKRDNFKKGQAWYRAHFPLMKNVDAHSRVFEASPLYMFNPLGSRRIFNLLPDVKLIVVLRNPTERAISHYFHEVRKGCELLPIQEALWEEDRRLASVIADKDYKNDVFRRQSYKSRGLYMQQLTRLLNNFPRRQLLVLNSESLFCEPGDTLRKVFEFLGVDPGFQAKELRPRNIATNRSEVDPSVYEYLNNYFAPHNKDLYELIGEDYGW